VRSGKDLDDLEDLPQVFKTASDSRMMASQHFNFDLFGSGAYERFIKAGSKNIPHPLGCIPGE
jgi:hypothetical protein